MANYQLGDNVLRALIKQESGGNPNAVSPKGARGLTQIMPATAKNPGYGVTPLRDNSQQEQIRFTRDYMSALLKVNGGDLNKALAAYNAGQGNVNKYGGVPPFKETQHYVKNILKMANPIGSANANELDDGEWVDDPTPQEAQTSANESDWVDDDSQQEPVQANEEQSLLAHKAGVAARGLIEGVTAIPQTIYNAASAIRDLGADRGFSPDLRMGHIDTEKYGSNIADTFGFPKATESENILYPVSKAVGNFALPASVLSKAGQAAGVVKSIGTQLPGMIAGQAAGEAVKDAGLNPTWQMAANIGGNILAGKGIDAINAVGRTAKALGTGGLGVQSGLEAVAGRTLNRAAGAASPEIIQSLERGVVPTIAKPIHGYAPKTTEIAGNAGISTIMRQNNLNADNLTELGQRSFDNAKAIADYVFKRIGSDSTREAVSQKIWNRTEKIVNPMRERNLPVDLTNVRATLDNAINRHSGNKLITDALEKVKKDLPEGESTFNTVLNFKQGLDQALRSKNLTDPEIASLKRAKTALNDTKKALTNTLTETEPGFREYVTKQAKGMSFLEGSGKAAEMYNKSRSGNSLVGLTGAGQEEIRPVLGNRLLTKLEGKDVNKLMPKQRQVLENAQKHASLPSRAGLGLPVGSATAQNLAIKDLVYNDLIKAGFGENGKIGKVVGGLGARLGSLPGVKNVTGALGEAHAEKLSRIFTKAELDPKYAAQLMKTYGLGHMNFNDPAGRAALRGLILSTQSK